jgi:hypothetical protein
MAPLRSLRWSIAALALIGARPVLANPITFTGFVANDFSASNPNVNITPVSNSPLTVGPAQYIVNAGQVSGWAVQDIRTSYDTASDTLYVGFAGFNNSKGVPAIFGDADGNGNPGVTGAQMAAAGGVNTAHLGGDKSFALAVAPSLASNSTLPGTPAIIAGIPADKTFAGPGTDGFTVASYVNPTLGLSNSFGAKLPNYQGTLAFDPSAQHPQLEFTIKNFSKIPGIDPSKGFWIQAYAGSLNDVVVGEMGLDFTKVPAFASGAQNIPEPAALIAWTLVAGAAALRYRRRGGR